MDKKTKLTEVRNALKAYVTRDELTDDEVKKMGELNSEALKLQGQIAADEQLAQHEAEEKERIENEKREAVEAARKEEAAKFRRLGEAPYQAKHSDAWKYDNLDATDLSLLLEGAPRMGVQIDRPAAIKARTTAWAMHTRIQQFTLPILWTILRVQRLLIPLSRSRE